VVRRIVALTRTLEKFPLAGRKVPEFEDENLRELIAYSYRIIYRVEVPEVIVAAVIHGKRNLESE
jgi:toxin ParE1/3/4